MTSWSEKSTVFTSESKQARNRSARSRVGNQDRNPAARRWTRDDRRGKSAPRPGPILPCTPRAARWAWTARASVAEVLAGSSLGRRARKPGRWTGASAADSARLASRTRAPTARRRSCAKKNSRNRSPAPAFDRGPDIVGARGEKQSAAALLQHAFIIESWQGDRPFAAVGLGQSEIGIGQRPPKETSSKASAIRQRAWG